MENMERTSIGDYSKLKSLLLQNKDRIFSVHFIKKDGSLRKMICRLEVHKDVKGVGVNLSLEAASRILKVWDIQKAGWRSIPLDRVIEVRMLKQKYTI